MKKLLLALLLLASPAFGQGVPNHAIPIGKGVNAIGWGSLAPGASGNVIQSNGTDFESVPFSGTLGLTSGFIYVGNVSNLATGVAMSGDCTIDSTGAVTCFSGVATSTVMGNFSGSAAHISAQTVPSCASDGIHALTNPTAGGFNCTLLSSISISQVKYQVFTTVGANTYTPTAGMQYVDVLCVGAGGAGGGTQATSAGQAAGGGGGGAGAIVEKIIDAATIGASQTVTIGAAGTGANGLPGNNGGDTTFGAILTAGGGIGGPVGVPGTLAINGGASGGNATGGDINISGQTGFDGWAIGNAGGTGLSMAYGGPGGPGYQGRMSTPAMSTTGGLTGVGAPAYGGGGGGAPAGSSTGQQTGGHGGAGICILTEYIQ